MDQTPRSDDSRERAVSSEPCSTRPNPFDDGDISSRKRRRTSQSLSGVSRSRSAETTNPPPDSSPATKDTEIEAHDDSAMKIDTDSAPPQTPEKQIIPSPSQPQSQPRSEPRSSRVTINVRTPRPLEAIPSSPPSPKVPISSTAVIPNDEVKISVEDSEVEMPREDASLDTPVSSSSDTSSPPVEVVSIQPDDDAEFDAGPPQVTILDDLRVIAQDPTPDFPYHDPSETYAETANRLTQYLLTHESVPKGVAEWIENYIHYAKSVNFGPVFESYREFQDLWQSVPDMVMSIINRKQPYPRIKALRHEIFWFYKWFAKLTAYFIEFDTKLLRNRTAADTSRLDLASPNYVHALAVLTRKEEFPLHSSEQSHNGDDDWSYALEVTDILDCFQLYHTTQGGSMAFLKQLANLEIGLIPRFPKLADSLGDISLLASNVLHVSWRKLQLQLPNQLVLDQAKNNIVRGYHIFKAVSSALSNIIEKHINHLSLEGATNHIQGLTDIYQISLAADRIVPPDVVKEHRQNRPPVSQQNMPEAIALDWRFTTYSKLIMSSQMQLRVMAVTAMCNDLVGLWRKYGEPLDESNNGILIYMADFLLRTGLVAYILGPTCHPEITIESSNIIGFLLVSKTYTNAHTDALWQTYTSTQDPRVSDALIRMVSRIANLFSYDGLIYLCNKLNTLPMEAFNPTARELCEQVLVQIRTKFAFDRGSINESAPYTLCIRLIRQSSIPGPHSPIAYPDVQQFAINKFKELLTVGPSADGRQGIYFDCLNDIALKSQTTLGSLWVLNLLIRPVAARDIRSLTSEHDLTGLVINELDNAILETQQGGFPAVIHGVHNTPRRDLITMVLLHEPSTVSKELGPRLWNLLVGSGAACREDRDAGWQILNTSLKKTNVENPFLSTCFAEYLPSLPPECFCPGTLEFIREAVLPLVNDSGSIILDDDDNVEIEGIEQLWRMILTAPGNTIEKQAIHTLVNDVYLDSRSIVAFPHYRARKVHLKLVGRCLRQLSSAAVKLKAFSDGTASGDDEPMVIVATDQQVLQQELLFIRSLAVLREFHQHHQTKAHFSAPDLRLLIQDSPKDVEGDSAELKFQSFDGDNQTEVKPLNIGKRNTAASLLASLREATGFSNYRIYYRGRAFVPQESELCKSLEDLHIHNGIILVKREADMAQTASSKVRPGASPVEVEILGHFDELWEYLTMEEKLAREIYTFLVKLPADENMLRMIEADSTSYKDLFPLGQSLKSLYAVYALREYIGTQWRRTGAAKAKERDQDVSDGAPSPYAVSLMKAMSLTVAAITDKEVIAQCPSKETQLELSYSLVGYFVHLLNDPLLPLSSSKLLDGHVLDRLLAILSDVSVVPTDSATEHVCLCLQGIFASCSFSTLFWSALCNHQAVLPLLGELLLNDARTKVRSRTARLIAEKVAETERERDGQEIDPAAAEFRKFFWPPISAFVGRAMAKPDTCAELLDLCHSMFKILRVHYPQILDTQSLLNDWTGLLLAYTTYEDVTRPEIVDNAAIRLVRLLYCILCGQDTDVDRSMLPGSGIARQFFWKHLFPPFERDDGRDESPRPILHPQTRRMLMDVVFALVGDDPTQVHWLLEDLDELVPVEQQDDDNYAYDLPQQFERSKAIRASCGYVGLKNLSNTCYLNSLFTQLFMNVDFRQFMMGAEIEDREHSQSLLFKTQNLFGLMQGSIRRFMNPEECVSCIKTYEDTQIDIHNQMDVDEFFNLLFDRWESQFLTAEAKKQFRAFYGGQLVQQVKSKECEHISERLEPFSAIQCDIKGKNNLEESLQAYVDGEIMEGDNKYKCSTCDRHVDAVKRACLKDIPDNLIFHLKRFDFNLRTLQRSKINDYFTFPNKLDMRPYTIDHLSSPTEDNPEDVFELVGVLVHSGTAESGHYYSYIRERPSSTDPQIWLEFNDDNVSTWDPALMETSCFGGPDYRPPYDSNGVVYDKTWSAYMLFYQRSSSLAKEQELLRLSGGASPYRVQIPPELERYIERENVSLLRRHCLYDPAQIQFVDNALARVKAIYTDQCSADHGMENLALQTALSHLDQVASRTKDTPDYYTFNKRINAFCQGCARCSLSVWEYFDTRSEVARALIQRNVDADVRHGAVNLIMLALQAIKTHMPQKYGLRPEDPDDVSEEDWEEGETSVMYGVGCMFKLFFDFFHQSVRSWSEIFGFMLAYVQMGPQEADDFLHHHLLKHILWTVCADPGLTNDLPPQYARLAVNVSRRLATRPPCYEEMIALLEILIERKQFVLVDDNRWPQDYGDQRLVESEVVSEGVVPYTRLELKILHWDLRSRTNVFIDRLVGINQNHGATAGIIATLIRRSQGMEERVYRTLRHAISGQITTHHNGPYLRVSALVFCRLASQAELINKLIAHVSTQCVVLQNAEGKAFFEFQRDVFDGPRENSGETPDEVLLNGLKNLPEWVPSLLGYYDPALANEVEVFLQEKLFQHGPDPAFEDSEAGRLRAERIVEAARTLGIRCLDYLRETYVNRRVDVQNRLAAGFERVIKECAKYYDLKEPEDEFAAEFHRLSQAVLEPLRRLTVDELEEDGSDWENSSVGSDQMGSFGDISMQAAGDLHDGEV